MKKSSSKAALAGILSFAAIFTAILGANAVGTAGTTAGTATTTTAPFSTNLSFGIQAPAQTKALQQFLAAQGLYSGPITGNFLSLTMQGVKQFQIIHNITPSTGYFGPLTRAKANAIVAIANATATSTPTTTTIISAATVATTTVITATNLPSPSLLAYVQMQLNSMFQTVRNLSQRIFGDKNKSSQPSVSTSSSGGGSAPVISSASPTSTSTTPAPTPQTVVTPTIVSVQTTATATLKISSTPSSSTPTQQTSQPTASKLSWGVYSGDTPSSLGTLQSLVGKSPNIEAIFLSMGIDSFPTNFTQTVGASGKTLLIFWEPDNGSDDVNQPSFNYSSILSGRYDTNMKQFAAAAKAYGYPVILVPMDEMNGNWQPWGGTVNGNTPAQFTQAWIHVHNLFAGVSNVKFGWDPNNESVPDTAANAISAYWPGAQYVDYVGVDGFNGNGDPWQSFSQVFPSSLMAQLAAYGKPVYIFSMGSTENSSDPTAKSKWITQGLGPNGAISKFPNLAGWIWFNENGGDSTSNWLVNSDPAALAAFQAAIP